jgi:hypothetical protein
MLKDLNKKEIVNKILFLLGLLLFIYTALRAYILSFTFDESSTYLIYVRRGFVNFKTCVDGDTNNHLLNTWLMELSIKVFGTSEFTLRLPNIFAHLIYLIYSAKLVRNLSSKGLIIGAFLILNLNPFLLDFFSLARGYGLSIGFMMASTYFAYKFIESNNDYFSACISLIFGSLSVLSYFILINYLVILSAMLFLISLYKIVNDNIPKRKRMAFVLLRNSFVIFMPLTSLFYILPIMIKLKNAGSMAFGGVDGFWKDTVHSLVLDILWMFPNIDLTSSIIEIFIALIIISSFLYLINNLIINKSIKKNLFFISVFSLLILCFAANLVQKRFMHILYPMGRYALYYFPLFSILLIYLFEQLYTKFGGSIKAAFLGITFFFITNFLLAFNLNYVHDWQSESDIKNMINFLIKHRKEIPPKKNNLMIGISSQFPTDIDFYRGLYHIDWLNAVTSQTSMYPLNDYFYIEKKDSVKLPNIKSKTIKEFTNSNTFLILNEQKWKSKVLFFDKNDFENLKKNDNYPAITVEHPFGGKYCSKINEKWNSTQILCDTVNDTLLKYQNVLASFKVMVYANNLHTDAVAIIVVNDGIKNIFFTSANITDCIRHSHIWTPMCFSAIIPNYIKKGNTISAFLITYGYHNVYIDNMEMKISGYEECP